MVLLIAFFAVLFTGRWPEGLRTFIVGYMRWVTRVEAYVALLTDPTTPVQPGLSGARVAPTGRPLRASPP